MRFVIMSVVARWVTVPRIHAPVILMLLAATDRQNALIIIVPCRAAINWHRQSIMSVMFGINIQYYLYSRRLCSTRSLCSTRCWMEKFFIPISSGVFKSELKIWWFKRKYSINALLSVRIWLKSNWKCLKPTTIDDSKIQHQYPPTTKWPTVAPILFIGLLLWHPP